jgi:glycosyltransferase involved in cell wall biosynthesis
MVSICCATYNHENYIINAIEGFLRQEVNFPIEIIIHDDASTDNTTRIINEYCKQYSNIIAVIQPENLMSKGQNPTIDYCLLKAKGKYIALCDGDDYWTDPLKLQKQVDFLENNPDFSICWTDYKVQRADYFENNEWEGVLKLDSNKIINLDNFGYPYCTYTFTVCFKKEILENVNFNMFKHFKDNSLYILALLTGKGLLMNTKTAVYRKHSTSIYSSKTLYVQCLDNFLNLTENLVMFKNIRNEHFAFYFQYTKNELKSKIDRFSKNHFKVNLLILKFYLFFLFRDFNFFLKILRK